MTFQELHDKAPTHIQDLFIDLATMRERPDYHPESSAKEHIEIVVRRAIEFGDIDIIMAAFFHDIHKFETMEINEKTGWPTSPGHDKWAQKTIEKDQSVWSFIYRAGANPDIVAGICGQHMRMHQIQQMKPAKQKALHDLHYFTKLAVFACFDDMLATDEDCQQRANWIMNAPADEELFKTLGKFDKNR